MAGPELDGDGSELVPPLFTKATFNALGQFEHLRTLVCPIWEKDGEKEMGNYHEESMLSTLSEHCPSLRGHS